jgi:hypothetical protein
MDENEDKIEKESEDKTCPSCGLRQYGDICQNCGIPLDDDHEDEMKKKEDDDQEYDWRERR